MLLSLKPFDVKDFLDSNFNNIDYLEDKSTDALQEVDFNQVKFINNVAKNELLITGHEELRRLRWMQKIYGVQRLGGNVAQALLAEKDHSTLEKLRNEKGIWSLLFFGNIAEVVDCTQYIIVVDYNTYPETGWNFRLNNLEWQSISHGSRIPILVPEENICLFDKSTNII